MCYYYTDLLTDACSFILITMKLPGLMCMCLTWLASSFLNILLVFDDLSLWPFSLKLRRSLESNIWSLEICVNFFHNKPIRFFFGKISLYGFQSNLTFLDYISWFLLIFNTIHKILDYAMCTGLKISDKGQSNLLKRFIFFCTSDKYNFIDY